MISSNFTILLAMGVSCTACGQNAVKENQFQFQKSNRQWIYQK